MLKQKLIQEIKSKGYTASGLSKIADVQRTQIGNFLKGKKNITLHTADEILKAMGIVDVIFVFREDL